jgi:hypothetical protein
LLPLACLAWFTSLEYTPPNHEQSHNVRDDGTARGHLDVRSDRTTPTREEAGSLEGTDAHPNVPSPALSPAARCADESNTTRFFVLTFRQMDWCFDSRSCAAQHTHRVKQRHATRNDLRQLTNAKLRPQTAHGIRPGPPIASNSLTETRERSAEQRKPRRRQARNATLTLAAQQRVGGC